MNGYLNPLYAESLSEFGIPCRLSRCGGWILERQIPGFPDKDAIGCYPLFLCEDWSRLPIDLEMLKEELVSLSLVTDPFGYYDSELLQRCFDVVIPLKEHFVVDLDQPTHLPRNHRYYARKALEKVSVELCHDPTQYVDEWIDLYGALIRRHNISGLAAFSRAAFGKQFSVPGLVMFRALYKGSAVGAYLWYVQDEVAYGHLGAVNSLGHDLMVSYAIIWTATEYFKGRVRWIDHGAGAGIKARNNDGLVQFKRGWSTGTRTVYFCGRVFHREKYDKIVRASGVGQTEYFPAYRKGEFG
jgi:hypothetical protein